MVPRMVPQLWPPPEKAAPSFYLHSKQLTYLASSVTLPRQALPEGFLFYPATKTRRERNPGWEGRQFLPETHTGLAQNGAIQGTGGRGGGVLGGAGLLCQETATEKWIEQAQRPVWGWGRERKKGLVIPRCQGTWRLWRRRGKKRFSSVLGAQLALFLGPTFSVSTVCGCACVCCVSVCVRVLSRSQGTSLGYAGG